jgi:hypothetical protein
MPAKGATFARGIQRVWDPRVWGTMVGAVGATVFVLSNRTDLVRPWPAIALLAWAGGLAAYAWFVFAASRHFPAVQPVGRRAGLVYLGSVVAMLALIRVGTIVLESQQRSALRPAVIVVAVGLHFLPFARAFRTPMFTILGLLMAGLGTLGLILGWFWYQTAAPATAVLAGLVMLAVLAVDAARSMPRRA